MLSKKVRDKLTEAILLLDAKFGYNNGKQHIRKHTSELGQTPSQYRKAAKLLSEQPIGGNIGGYIRKDGREVRFNKATREYVVFKGNTVITYYKLNQSQYEKALKGEY